MKYGRFWLGGWYLFFVSIYAYFSKVDSSLWLRERLLADAMLVRVGQGGKTVCPAEFDAVLRFHCGMDGARAPHDRAPR